jgi:shikimate kinase
MKKTEKSQDPPLPFSGARPEGFPENLVLIGMFGSGKSTVGKILAQHLRYHFVDVDHLIEAKFRKPLQRILDDLGTRGFMRMEEQTLLSLRNWHCVISPGGSAVYYPRAMRHLRGLGPRVFLKASLPELKKRLPDWSNRGVIRRGGETLAALFRERAPLLAKHSDLTVRTRGKSPERTAREILEALSPRTQPGEKRSKRQA